MRRSFAIFIAIGAICFAARWTQNVKTFAAGEETAVLQVDNALQEALGSKDAKAAAALLDQQFTWTNEAGETVKSAQFLRDSSAGTIVGDTKYLDVKAREYGQLVIVTGAGKRTAYPDTFFARVWVKRPAGWLLLTHQDTAIIPKPASSPQAPPAGNTLATSDC